MLMIKYVPSISVDAPRTVPGMITLTPTSDSFVTASMILPAIRVAPPHVTLLHKQHLLDDGYISRGKTIEVDTGLHGATLLVLSIPHDFVVAGRHVALEQLSHFLPKNIVDTNRHLSRPGR